MASRLPRPEKYTKMQGMACKVLTPRNYNIITKFLRAQKSVLVLGPRGSGKTSFLSELVRELPGGLLSIDLLKKSSSRGD